MAGSETEVWSWEILAFTNKIINNESQRVLEQFPMVMLQKMENCVHYLENLTFWPCYLAFQYNKSLKIL